MKKKFIDLHVVKNGGWHFTRILSPQEIHSRELETEHSDEYLESKKDSKKIEDLIRRKVIDHNHLADKRENKFGEEFDLKLYPVKNLPDYIENNQIKYKNYLDLE
jgi:beta-1,4-mannosyl-glycoprotein beta-1,4-N-acetylglucosaminyltransferase